MAIEKDPKRPGKKAGRSESRRFGTLIRTAEDVVADARIVASYRGTSMAELISDTMRPLLKQMIEEEHRKHSQGGRRG